MKLFSTEVKRAAIIVFSVEAAILTAVFIFGEYVRVVDATVLGLAFGVISIFISIAQIQIDQFNKKYTSYVDALTLEVNELKAIVERQASQINKLELMSKLLQEVTERSFANTADIRNLNDQFQISNRLERLEARAEFTQKQIDESRKCP